MRLRSKYRSVLLRWSRSRQAIDRLRTIDDVMFVLLYASLSIAGLILALLIGGVSLLDPGLLRLVLTGAALSVIGCAGLFAVNVVQEDMENFSRGE